MRFEFRSIFHYLIMLHVFTHAQGPPTIPALPLPGTGPGPVPPMIPTFPVTSSSLSPPTSTSTSAVLPPTTSSVSTTSSQSMILPTDPVIPVTSSVPSPTSTSATIDTSSSTSNNSPFSSSQSGGQGASPPASSPSTSSSTAPSASSNGGNSSIMIGIIVFVSILIGSIVLTAAAFFAIRWNKDRRNDMYDHDSPFSFALWDQFRQPKSPDGGLKTNYTHYGELESGNGSPIPTPNSSESLIGVAAEESDKVGNSTKPSIPDLSHNPMPSSSPTPLMPAESIVQPPIKEKIDLASEERKRLDILKQSGIGSSTVRQKHAQQQYLPNASQAIFPPAHLPPGHPLPALSHQSAIIPGQPYTLLYPVVDGRVHSFSTVYSGSPVASGGILRAVESHHSLVPIRPLSQQIHPNEMTNLVIGPTNPGMPVPPMIAPMFHNMNSRRFSLTRSEPDESYNRSVNVSLPSSTEANIEVKEEPSSAPETLENTPTIEHDVPIGTERKARMSLESLHSIPEEDTHH